MATEMTSFAKQQRRVNSTLFLVVLCPLTYSTYMVMEYCVGVLQEILESAPEKKFPIWQAHK